MNANVFCADIMEWCKTYDGPKFHALLCDPSYGLTSKAPKEIVNGIVDALSDLAFPYLDEWNPELAKQIDLHGVAVSGLPLSRSQVALIIDTGIGVPECSVDLDGDSFIREEEVQTTGESSCARIADYVLPDECDSSGGEFLGDYILDLRDAVDLARRNVLGSGYAEFSSGSFSVPVSSVVAPNLGGSLPCFLLRYAPGFGDCVGLGDNALGEPCAPASIGTGGAAVNSLMLRFDLRRRTCELIPTHRTDECNTLRQLGATKLVGALPTTCSLPSMFEPCRVSIIGLSADGTNAAYIRLWLKRDLWNHLDSIIPSGGFMGKDWDSASPDAGMWSALAEHLHPGAFGMAFASSRGWHRLAVAIEDAGMRLHPSIFGFAFGSGFPKATRIDTQIDKAVGAKRTIIGTRRAGGHPLGHGEGSNITHNAGVNLDSTIYPEINKTAPSTDLAKAWAGHRYGLQAMKPALEPIIVFQKPYEGKPVECIVETGAGSLWIDGGRIATDESWDGSLHDSGPSIALSGGADGSLNNMRSQSNPQGRWPANFYLEHHPACFPDGEDTIACHPDCPVRRLGEQSGESTSLANKMTDNRRTPFYRAGDSSSGGYSGEHNPENSHNDTGTAARFFFNVNRQLDEADPVLYCAKASRKERDAGMPWEFNEIYPQNNSTERGELNSTKNKRVRNAHPTIKPIDLTRWLATLLLPPAEYAPRRILVPFSGSGSEMIGAHLAGWEEIIGIEMEKEYVEIAGARLEYWCKMPKQIVLI